MQVGVNFLGGLDTKRHNQVVFIPFTYPTSAVGNFVWICSTLSRQDLASQKDERLSKKLALLGLIPQVVPLVQIELVFTQLIFYGKMNDVHEKANLNSVFVYPSSRGKHLLP